MRQFLNFIDKSVIYFIFFIKIININLHQGCLIGLLSLFRFVDGVEIPGHQEWLRWHLSVADKEPEKKVINNVL